MLDNYLTIANDHFKSEYPDKRIKVCYLECVDCMIYNNRLADPVSKGADIYVFIGFAEDSCIHENMYKAISFSIETNVICIIAFIENEHALATKVDYSVKPVYSTECLHIMLTFNKTLHTIETMDHYKDIVDEILRYFRLPSACYISETFVKNISAFANVRVYKENKGVLTERVIRE